MLVVADQTHRSHHCLELDNGRLVPSWESPDRAEYIDQSLRADGHEFVEPAAVDRQLLERVHSAEYIGFLSTAWERWLERPNAAPAAMGFTWPTRGLDAVRPDDIVGRLGFHSFAADCSIVDGTWRAVEGSAAIAVTAADRVSAGAPVVYARCRPPGHHATVDQFGGYCYVNNAALAAQRLLDLGAERVAVLDVDYHHGNGTQSIFFARSDVLTVSIHADPIEEFPWFAGHSGEEGSGDGSGWNLNLPLPCGSGWEPWSDALDAAIRRIEGAGADALVVPLGVDTFEDDPISTFGLTSDHYPRMAERIRDLGLPTVVTQEGGYAVEAIGVNVAGFLAGWAV